ncbi:asparagine synthase (glutamine-hydrolyzing) [Mesorhizobium sp. M0142]|uniref:asparagine synthase (glutamine-hydrolyzing) n=1 Tax=Mesorhizobium sp. M0142 TaxID=2956894 RepID=UPI0033370A5E
MCGLFGVYRAEGFSPDDIHRADQARDTLVHRGPNYGGARVTSDLYHGFRRLSIIDLSAAGNQPMVSADGKFAITVNGEIYNYRELRADLIAKGCVFTSQSDSEVVLHGYRVWGLEELCEKLDGMYAAVIHDGERRKLHAIRDRPGMKPFFYFHSGRRFAWASELKALQAWLGDDLPPIDETAVLDYLACRYIPAPKSLYRNIFKLPAASRLTFDLETGRVDVGRYWTMPTELRSDNDDRLADGLRGRMQASVAAHMVSDVPVGYFLSGGIDSAVVLSHAVAVNPTAKAFSIGFEDPRFDESAQAAKVAALFGAEHAIRILQPTELDDVFDRTREWYDEPLSDKAAVPAFRVCEFASRDRTVVLTGDGGDELFGGYRSYKRFSGIRRKQRFLPFGSQSGWRLKDRNLRLITTRDPVELSIAIGSGRTRWQRDVYRERLAIAADYDELAHLRAWWKPELGPLRSLQYLDFHTSLPNNILTKVDRLSMSVSLEARIPFLSRTMIEYAFSLPESFLYKDGQLKGGLKYAYRNVLPASTLKRKKQGFGLPQSWKRTAVASQSEESYQEAVLSGFLKGAKFSNASA